MDAVGKPDQRQQPASSPRQAVPTRLLLFAVLALTFVLHLLVVAEPFGRDQGIFAYIGQSILHGGVPYVDAWDHKTPGLYGIYALAFALFGNAMSSLHLLEGLFLTLGAFIIFLIGRRLRGESLGLLGALIYGMSATLLFEWWDRGQAEIYMGISGAAVVYFLLRAYDVHLPSLHSGALSLLSVFMAGILCGLTIYLKPSGAPFVAGAGILLLILAWGDGLKQVAGAVAALIAGFALAFIPLLAYYAAHGALGDLYQTIVVFNSYHARIGGNPTLAGSATGTLDFLASMNILAPLALAGAWGMWQEFSAHKAASKALLALPLWILAAAAGVWTQGKFFSYHWSSTLPALSLLAAWGLLWLVAELRPISAPASRLAALAVCFAMMVVYGAALLRDHAPKWQRDGAHLLGQVSKQDFLAGFAHNIGGRDIYSFSQAQETADYLRAHSTPDDTVLVWGFQTLVNYLADRQAPTRYTFNYPLTFDRPETAFRVDARRTFLSDIAQEPPLYVVLVTNDVNPVQAVDSRQLLQGFPELQQIIQQNYHLETTIGEFHVYRRNDA